MRKRKRKKGLRQTTFAVRCRGDVIAHVNSYYSKEQEYGQLLHSASMAADKLGYICLDKMKDQRGVACEMMTVEALDAPV